LSRAKKFARFSPKSSRRPLGRKRPRGGYSGSPSARQSQAVRSRLYDAEKVIKSRLKAARLRRQRGIRPPNQDQLKEMFLKSLGNPQSWQLKPICIDDVVWFVPPGQRVARSLVQGVVLKVPDRRSAYIALERLGHFSRGSLDKIEVVESDGVVAGLWI
jgi:hypothetical protein